MFNLFRRMCFLVVLMSSPLCLHSDQIGVSNDLVCKSSVNRCPNLSMCRKRIDLVYYLNVPDFIRSFIRIPTSPVLADTSTLSSVYLAGRAPVYNINNEKVGVCSASFLCMQNADAIYTDISNFLSVNNGLVISWLTPTTLINLELDSIVNGMVTECLVVASTKVGVNPFYGKTFNMIVSSESGRIYFKLTKL
jgi:hypothetical protein